MNREQREALIERLKVEKAATLADMAQRRAARDAVGDYDPLPLVQRSQPAQQFVYKMNPNALNDTPQPQPPQLSLLSRADLLATVDELAASSVSANVCCATRSTICAIVFRNCGLN